jgi:hypothetical protein
VFHGNSVPSRRKIVFVNDFQHTIYLRHLLQIFSLQLEFACKTCSIVVRDFVELLCVTPMYVAQGVAVHYQLRNFVFVFS